MEILCVPVGPLQANCYVIWDSNRYACVVDPGAEPERIVQLLEDRGLTLEAILVTHGHFDHVEGVEGVAKATGARIYCSPVTKRMLTGEDVRVTTGLPVAQLDSVLIEEVGETSEIRVGELVVEVIATPGHTPGDLTFEIGGHLFCGDLLFHGSVGRTDFPGGDFSVLLASVGKLAGRYGSSTPVHPGHMRATTLGDELEFNPFLSGLKIGD